MGPHWSLAPVLTGEEGCLRHLSGHEPFEHRIKSQVLGRAFEALPDLALAFFANLPHDPLPLILYFSHTDLPSDLAMCKLFPASGLLGS